MSARELSVREWAGERLQNSIRIAGQSSGKDRDGWLEDVWYWRRICAALEELDTPCRCGERAGGCICEIDRQDFNCPVHNCGPNGEEP